MTPYNGYVEYRLLGMQLWVITASARQMLLQKAMREENKYKHLALSAMHQLTYFLCKELWYWASGRNFSDSGYVFMDMQSLTNMFRLLP